MVLFHCIRRGVDGVIGAKGKLFSDDGERNRKGKCGTIGGEKYYEETVRERGVYKEVIHRGWIVGLQPSE